MHVPLCFAHSQPAIPKGVYMSPNVAGNGEISVPLLFDYTFESFEWTAKIS